MLDAELLGGAGEGAVGGEEAEGAREGGGEVERVRDEWGVYPIEPRRLVRRSMAREESLAIPPQSG